MTYSIRQWRKRKAQIKSQHIINKKTKGHSSTQNTSLENDAICCFNLDAIADVIPPSSNQLVQKMHRAASSEITAILPQQKKSKHHGPSQQADEVLDNPAPPIKSFKGKGKIVVSAMLILT